MSVVREVMGEGLDAMDRGVLPWLYARASVDTEAERARLRARGLSFRDPAVPGGPRDAAVGRTVDLLIDEAARTAGSTGALAGLAGALGIGPEAASWLVEMVRLVQRMAIAEGLDPHSVRGRVVLTRALSAALEVPLPRDGLVDARLSRVARGRGVAGGLVRAVASRVAWQSMGRLLRWIPGLASAQAAVELPARTRAAAARARAVLREGVAGDPLLVQIATEAVEVEGPSR